MARQDIFPYSFDEDGIISAGNGFEVERITGICRVVGSAVSHAIVKADGSAITLNVEQQFLYAGFRTLHPLTLASAGVLKVAQASNADATAATTVAAIARTDRATALAAATSFPANTSGWSLARLGTVTQPTAATLRLFGRDAGAAGAADVAISPGVGAPVSAAGVPTALVIVELFVARAKAPLKLEDVKSALSKDDQLLMTRVIQPV